jgi:transcriptional regulator with XRE-family HTH domain
VQEKKRGSDPVVERLRRYQVSQGMPWHRVADRLGLTRGMVMMVLRGDRRLSAKALFRLEQAEREALDRRSAAERIVEGLIGEGNALLQALGPQAKGKGTVDVPVDYEAAKPSRSLPTKVALLLPEERDCRKLRSLFAETLDTRLITLACLPKQLRTEGFLDTLTPESRTRLTNAALGLVIPDWRTLVTGGM